MISCRVARAAHGSCRRISTIRPNNTASRLLSSLSDTTTTETAPTTNRYAVVEHGDLYMEEMAGRHGKQLALAYEEGKRGQGKYLPDDLLDKFSLSLDDLLETRSSPLSEPAEQGDSEIDDEMEEEDLEEEEEDVEEINEEYMLEQYNADGSPKISREDRLAYQAGAPAGGKFAIIQLNGTQHKVTVDDVVIQSKLKPVEKWKVGETVALQPHEILLLGSSERTLVGLPGISGASVKLLVEEITLDAKVTIFKKRRKKHSQRRRGFRREVTILRVVEIDMPQQFQQTSAYREQMVG